MQELPWMTSHLGTLDKAVELAHQMYWNMTVEEKEDSCTEWGGDQAIFRSDTREGLEAFLYGFGLAYAVIPDEVFRQTIDILKPWVDYLFPPHNDSLSTNVERDSSGSLAGLRRVRLFLGSIHRSRHRQQRTDHSLVTL